MAKNLIVCCDGTWNTPEQREGGQPCPTNVVKLYNLSISDDTQLKYYHPGVGTKGGIADRIFGGGLGAGLSRNIQSAYEWLCRHYVCGDRIFLFGFSRGAYTARSLGGFIGRCGLLDLSTLTDKEAWERIANVYEKGYRQSNPKGKWPAAYRFIPGPLADGKVDIHMIGVWDTVGALGVPDDLILLDQVLDDPRNYRFHDTKLSPIVRHARHAVGMDEMRASFAPTLWDTDSPRPDDGSFKQQWFAGVHSDVGGGYVESGLSDCTLKWMVDEAVAVGLQVNPALLAQIQPNPRGVLHDSATGIWEHLRTLPRATPLITPAQVGETVSPQVIDRHVVPPLTQAPYWPTRVLAVGEEVRLTYLAVLSEGVYPSLTLTVDLAYLTPGDFVLLGGNVTAVGASLTTDANVYGEDFALVTVRDGFYADELRVYYASRGRVYVVRSPRMRSGQGYRRIALLPEDAQALDESAFDPDDLEDQAIFAVADCIDGIE